MGSFGDELNEVRRENTGSSKWNVDMGYYGNEIFTLMKGVKSWRKKNKDFCAFVSASRSFTVSVTQCAPCRQRWLLPPPDGWAGHAELPGRRKQCVSIEWAVCERTSQIGSMWKPGACVHVRACASTGCAVMCESRLSSKQLRVRSCLVMHIRNSSPLLPPLLLTPPPRIRRCETHLEFQEGAIRFSCGR